MLRNLAFALLGLSLLSGPAAARGDGPAGGRRAEAKAAAGAKVERTFLLRRVAATSARPAAALPGPAACGRAARGVLRCRAAVQAVSWRWAQGLPPALGVQAQECPLGTMATLAEGHEDIVRCIPI